MTKQERTLITRIMSAKTDEEMNRALGEVDTLYQHDKIKWDDHELYFTIAAHVIKAADLFKE